MVKTVNKKVIIFILILLIDIFIGYIFFTNRLFSHLAIWSIIESDRKEDFYWKPEEAPDYFYFQSGQEYLSQFKNEVMSLIGNEKDEYKRVLKAADYIYGFKGNGDLSGLQVKWESPMGILRQMKRGAYGNCFDKAVLFSTYLASIGIKSRLWALENENFNGTAHTVNDVYIESYKKWVFIDVMNGFYCVEGNIPLSYLEFRAKILGNNGNKLQLRYIFDKDKTEEKLIGDYYKKLIITSFLRSNNNFLREDGFPPIPRRYVNIFPNKMKRGLEYLFNNKNIFIHYVDGSSPFLRYKIIAVKALFYGLIFISGILLIVIIFWRKICLSGK